MPDEVWRRRHLTIVAVVAAHVPALFAMALVQGFGLGHALLEVAPIVGAIAVGALVPSRGLRMAATTMGLLTASGVLVHLSGGVIEMHFHFFFALGLVTLYQSWQPFLLAVGFVVLQHGLIGAINPAAVYNHAAAEARPWTWAFVHGGFVLAASAAQIAFWRLTERATADAEESYRRLYEGEHAVVEKLRESQRMKDSLVAVVSHEFRTPLTAIAGFAETMAAHGEQLTAEQRAHFVERIQKQSDRLSRMVENVLVASRMTQADPNALASVAAVVADTIDELSDVAEPGHIRVGVDADLYARISEPALHHVLLNLLTNAIKFRSAESAIEVRGTDAGDQMVLEVTNRGGPIPAADLDRVFEAFVQLDSSSTRQAGGVGLGLAIVQGLVETHGGSVVAASHGEQVTFTVRLPRAPAPSTELPMPATPPVANAVPA